MRVAWMTALVCLSVRSGLCGENWSQFRGGRSDGVVRNSGIPTEWSEDRNIAWKIEIPGMGWSQPVIWGDRVFLTTAVAGDGAKTTKIDWSPGVPNLGLRMLTKGLGLDSAPKEGGGGTAVASRSVDMPPPDIPCRYMVMCLDLATGKPLWERTARESKPPIHIHPSNSYATETPATDGERLVVSFGPAGLYCFDLNGEPLWSKDLGSYPMQFGWGSGSSPVLHGGRVFVQYDNEAESFLVALDAKTSDELWRVKREEQSNWSTPYLWTNSLRAELVTAGGTKMRSYDPQTGTLLWEMDASGRTSITPVGNDDLLYVDSYDRMMGRTGIFAAIRPGATGDISLGGKSTSNDGVAWSVKLSGYRVASPVLCADCLYVFEQQGGIVHCFDAKTGKKHYRQRLAESGGCTASPWVSDGKVFSLDTNGLTVVFEAGPTMKVVGSNKLDDLFWSSVAAADGRLLLRGVKSLYCAQGRR